ncbi:MAG: hypothetical protein A3B90_00790 [Candidatus Magasanikbacteria bacterium RIFCSPHIGHO2_02_FULL_41_13]|uniref:Glycosyltransferase 2-like domain-containing protein n=1 Tax=Candidatus Magasanikbacteria bacterium RIFCSPHIGHO2_02_FULL_41_13 TaxID=1798676 RepID=A0A1F6M4J6_9BACT|nr:MAG: hypothetical protein A3B90_00790 [Candidatus Magasanikbacteria bacterium RIFCSPHIGHO2_02_FULL_41_13]
MSTFSHAIPYHHQQHPIFQGIPSLQLKKPALLYKLSLILLAILVLALIITLKAKAGSIYETSPFLLFYTILVTSFELSRLLGAILFKRIDEKIINPEEIELQEEYEPTVSIIIPCKNEEQCIENTVKKCFSAEYPKEKIEVIVINDGSTDKTGEVLERMKVQYPHLKVIQWKKNRGKRHGMAAGFKKAKGEIVLQLDSDSYMDPKTFRNIIKPFVHKEIAAVCAHADPENADLNTLTKMQAAYYFMSFRIMKAAESVFLTVFCCSGCSSAYRREVVMPILDTWLHETFLGLPVTWGDDRALTNWVLRLGYRSIYTDQAKAFTIVPTTLKQFLKQQTRWKKGWFVNSMFASQFIYKRHPFVALSYFFPLILITILTPFMAAKALVYNPVVHGIPPYYYIAGVFLVATMITIYYRWVSRENKYWPYLFVWSGINLIFLSCLLFYALATIQDRKWGTR